MGFDVKRFVSKVTDDRKCSLCHLVLDNPVKTPCSHVFCSGCALPWVVHYGWCPMKCQTLEPADLDNVLNLRDLVLNMKVLCDFKENGCSEILKLRDLAHHIQECDARTVNCRNSGCECEVPLKELDEHETRVCEFRPSGMCKKGCGILLPYNSLETHDCLSALNLKVVEQEETITSLKEGILNIKNKSGFRERFLMSKISKLTGDLQMQAMKFQNQCRNYQSQMDDILATKNNSYKCTSKCGEDQSLTLMLERISGSLGFNIMGGYSVAGLCRTASTIGYVIKVDITASDGTQFKILPLSSQYGEDSNRSYCSINSRLDKCENNNNNTKQGMVTEGIIVSRVINGGPADLKGLKTHDQVVKHCIDHFGDVAPSFVDLLPNIERQQHLRPCCMMKLIGFICMGCLACKQAQNLKVIYQYSRAVCFSSLWKQHQ